MPRESSSPEGELKALLAERPVRPQSVADLLDGLGQDERVRAIRSLGRGPQSRLYEAVDGFRPVCLADLVPPGVGDFVPVHHFGRNTLPAFTHFEKRFCRPRDADPKQPGELYGFNFHTLAPLAGPGYFVAREDPGRPEVWVDYNQDLDFDDPGERMVGEYEGGLFHVSIEPPVDALLGETRMRIRVGIYGDDAMQCGILVSPGEVEDYTVNITDGPGACCTPAGDCLTRRTICR